MTVDVAACAAGVLVCDRTWLGRAVTLVESNRQQDQAAASQLLELLQAHTGSAQRVGVTGVPGVGKSTFIDTLGSRLVAAGHRVAVLAVDPSSTLTGGSILGDRTRMPRLGVDPAAYVRPTPTSGTLGGVARATPQVISVVEAAGFDVVLVETVGVGQSETTVAQMVDFLLVLLLPGAGDELQGIKKGVLELADAIVVNKADSGNETAAARAAQDYAAALALTAPASANWTPPVLTCSATQDTGVAEVWQAVEDHRRTLSASGELADKRAEQRVRQMWAALEWHLLGRFREDPAAEELVGQLEAQVAAGELPPDTAAEQLAAISMGGRD